MYTHEHTCTHTHRYCDRRVFNLSTGTSEFFKKRNSTFCHLISEGDFSGMIVQNRVCVRLANFCFTPI